MKKTTIVILSLILSLSNISYVFAQDNNNDDTSDDILVSYEDQQELFLSMDEEGNVEYIPIDIDSELESDIDLTNLSATEDGEAKDIQSMNEANDLIEDSEANMIEATVYTKQKQVVATTTPSIVRFKATGVINYTEVGTNIAGYTAASYGADAAYLETSSDGSKVKFKLAGVTGWVASNKVEIVPYTNKLNLSYYKVLSDRLYHYISTNINGTSAATVQRVGEAPDYLKEDTIYYSYDGHYFYKSFATMISDYKKGSYGNAINSNNPHYNYYQFLSLRSTSNFSASHINTRLKQGLSRDYTAEKTKLYNAGNSIKAIERYGVNAGITLGVAINESGWGRSAIAMNKNNIFGLNAADASPSISADTFSSVSACISDFAKNWMSLGYLSPFDWRYYGPHLGDKQSGINVKYASDPYWGEKAAAQCYYLEDIAKTKDRKTISVETKSNDYYLYASPSNSATKYYRNRNYDGKIVKQFPFTVNKMIINSQGVWFEVLSDAVIKSDRSNVASESESDGIYSNKYCYGYIKASPSTYETTKEGLLPYSDVDSKQWYFAVVYSVIKNGFMDGISDTSFAPDKNATRASIVQTLYNMENKPSVSYKKIFPDVASNHANAKAITWAYQNNIINGHDDGTFKPKNAISREELAVMLRNYMLYKGYNTTSNYSLKSFKDYQKVSGYSYSAMQWIVEHGILDGTNEGYLLPHDNASRAHVAKMIYVCYELIK